MNDLIVFSLGVAAGALAVFLPWVGPAYKKYVVNCQRIVCPHHGPLNARRMNEARQIKPPTHIDH